MKSKILQILSAALIMLILCAGALKAFFAPVDEIPYENRYAEKLIPFSAETFSNQQFQDSMESALADQVHMAIKAKKLYNIFDTQLALPAIEALAENGHGYIRFRDISFYNDMLVQEAETLEQNRQKIDYVTGLLNSYKLSNPDTEFFAFYIESDKDIDFESGEKAGFYEYLCEKLNFDKDKLAKLDVSSFDDYHKYFLKSDHHWNSLGADTAYRSICSMMQVRPLDSLGTHTEYERYHGTRSAGIEGFPAENFSVELYQYPELEYNYLGIMLDDYGRVDQFISGDMATISYGRVFGEDGGELIIRSNREGERLLIMGDSYDNPLLKPIASLFSSTHSVDLRAYETAAGKAFDMNDYITQNDIDKVLFIGTLEYFTAKSW